jgi:hypothetical protein
MAVHRDLALLLIPALIATSGMASSLHAHAYGDHDHPEHHHGLAVAHEHREAPAYGHNEPARLVRCDPSQHSMSFTFVCAGPPPVHAADAELPPPSSLSPERRIECTLERTDVRVHGPPARTHASPRAPPVIAHV